MLPIDAAAHTSRWRRRHPVDKAVLALGLTAAAVALPPWPGAVLVGAVTLVLLLCAARVPAGRLWRAFRVPLGFCVTGSLTLLVQVNGFSDPAGFVGPAPDGPLRAAELLARTGAASLAVLLFAFTTPLSDVLPRLTALGVPPAVVDVTALVYRMSFLLLDSVSTVREAQAARLGYTDRRAARRSLASLGATAFVRAFDHAARLQDGLAGRGYAGSLRVLVDDVRICPRFVAASLALVACVTGTALLLGRILP
ncbi:cobalt ECF transporter T component CbiQ [Streptomyces thermolineatus]|uniref:Cobalt ECF transporter T component CbiQ n=1 Tax=Streptomyces thermolineatus TaxID=44033 RepID=A0ABP5YT00_9ACTN